MKTIRALYLPAGHGKRPRLCTVEASAEAIKDLIGAKKTAHAFKIARHADLWVDADYMTSGDYNMNAGLVYSGPTAIYGDAVLCCTDKSGGATSIDGETLTKLALIGIRPEDER